MLVRALIDRIGWRDDIAQSKVRHLSEPVRSDNRVVWLHCRPKQDTSKRPTGGFASAPRVKSRGVGRDDTRINDQRKNEKRKPQLSLSHCPRKFM